MSIERPLPGPTAAGNAAGGFERPLTSPWRLRRWLAPGLALVALAIALATVGLAGGRRTAPSPTALPEPLASSASATSPAPVRPSSTAATPAATTAVAIAPMKAIADQGAVPVQPGVPSDPNDIATYYRPGDPVPTMSELIQALRESGVDTGIAAFNPPGTKPLLQGLVVPPDFPLPPGYLRHHQVTDDGVDVPAILLFAPDAQVFDRSGNPIALPEDRVVPPELAPPGMPIVPVVLPDP